MKIISKSTARLMVNIPSARPEQAIIKILLCIFAFFALSATPALSQSDDTINLENASLQPPATTAQPALNVVTAPTRQPLAPPPETPSNALQGAQAIAVQKGVAPVSLPQAWRLKALSMFKSGAGADKNNSIIQAKLPTPYRSSFEAVRKSLTDNNLTIEALSLSAGHILVSTTNSDGITERAIIALRQSVCDNGTDVRAFCDAKNRALTTVQLRSLFDRLSGGSNNALDQPGANSL